jgi:hypothetical protein
MYCNSANLWHCEDIDVSDLETVIGFDNIGEGYPIRNPHILTERNSAVSALRAKFPTLSLECCQLTLDEKNWNLRLTEAAAADLVFGVLQERPHEPIRGRSAPEGQGTPDRVTGLQERADCPRRAAGRV